MKHPVIPEMGLLGEFPFQDTVSFYKTHNRSASLLELSFYTVVLAMAMNWLINFQFLCLSQ